MIVKGVVVTINVDPMINTIRKEAPILQAE